MQKATKTDLSEVKKKSAHWNRNIYKITLEIALNSQIGYEKTLVHIYSHTPPNDWQYAMAR